MSFSESYTVSVTFDRPICKGTHTLLLYNKVPKQYNNNIKRTQLQLITILNQVFDQ